MLLVTLLALITLRKDQFRAYIERPPSVLKTGGRHAAATFSVQRAAPCYNVDWLLFMAARTVGANRYYFYRRAL